MKQTTILCTIIACITFFACNPLKPSNAAVQSNFHAVDSIPGTVALDMINHFKDTGFHVDIDFAQLAVCSRLASGIFV